MKENQGRNSARRQIRNPDPPSRNFALCLLIFLAGVALGAGSRWFDIHWEFLGTMFSNISVWIFLCTWIAVTSDTPYRAGCRVCLFLLGMLAAYYAVAEFTGGVWSSGIAAFWTAIALCSPILGFAAWYAGGRNTLAWCLSAGVIVCMIVLTWLLCGKIRFSDLLSIGAAVWFLFIWSKRPHDT